MKRVFAVISALFMLIHFYSCNSKKTSEAATNVVDSAAVARGLEAFTENCSACHNFQADGIGPQLGGITSTQSTEWIVNFIKDPKSVIESGDEHANELYERFKTIMPSYGYFPEEKLNDIVAYLSTTKTNTSKRQADDPNALRNPIIEPIPMSDLVVALKLVTQVPASSEEKPLTRITKLTNQPNTDKLFVVDLNGKLYQLGKNGPEVYLDLAAQRPNFIRKPGHATGFGSFAFHPDFAKNGLLYTSHAEAPGSGDPDFDYADSIKVTLQAVLTEWKTKDPGASPFVGESRELMRVNMVAQMHGMQEIVFNPYAKAGDEDFGLLYIGIGDGGSAELGYPFLCRDITKIWGTVIRIDPLGNNSANGKYGIPAINPFSNRDNPAVCKEIYAYGFRNPHRISWSKQDQILVGNIGHHMIESLYIISAGADCGWPNREGTFVIDPSQNMFNIYPPAADDGDAKINYPVAQYDHDEGNAIAAGFEYSGKEVPGLKGKYVFADIVKGRLFYVEMKDLKVGSQAPIKEWQVSLDGIPRTFTELCGADKVDLRFGIDRHGELYITTKPDGRIYKLVSSNNP